MATQTIAATTTEKTEATRRRFTIAEYQRMAEIGILTENERVELLAGEILYMSPIGARHVACMIALDELLHNTVGRDTAISAQNPIQMDDATMPQPDLTVLRRRSYATSLPTVADILLVIEVSDSTLAHDRGTKLPLYAAAGIAEAWIIDLAAETVERHTDPRGGSYRLVASARPGESLASIVLPALAIPVTDILT
ncbi:MAG: Uma2 family endonuclease [Chloroflexota bacterium]|nr:Uma2 family endonuclease [Chloroflexota bacterium]